MLRYGDILRRCKVCQVGKEGLEVQLGIECAQLVNLWTADCESLLIKCDRHIKAYRGQHLRQAQLLFVLAYVCSGLTANFIYIGNDVLYLSVGLHHLARALLSDAWNAWNVVGGVAPQRQDVAHQLWSVNAIFSPNCLLVHNLNAVALLLVEVAMFAYELSVILVGGYHIDLVARLFALDGQSSDNIVCLKAGYLQDRDTHRLNDALYIGHRLYDIVGRVGAVCLVCRIYISAEATSLRVKRNTEQVGLLALLDIAQKLREAKHNRGVHSVAIAHRTPDEGVVVFENQCVRINKKKPFHY